MATNGAIHDGMRTVRGDLATYARWEYGTREAAAWLLATVRPR